MRATKPIQYRSNVTLADVLAVVGTVTCTKQAGGACTAGVYNVKVVGGNPYGRTTPKAGDVAITTETTNLTVRAAFVGGLWTFFDIYCSIDADPKWIGRITEGQRAAGGTLTAVGVWSAAGGVPGAVDIEVPGTGLQSAVTAAENTAYAIPLGVPCQDFLYVDFDLGVVNTGDAVALTMSVIPFFYNGRDLIYYLGDPKTLFFGGVSGALQSFKQRIRVEVRGNNSMGLLVAKIAGTGAVVAIDYTLS